MAATGETFNRTRTRQIMLAAIGKGEVSVLMTLFFSAAADRTLAELQERGLAVLGRDRYELTAAGVALRAEWSRAEQVEPTC